MTDARTNEFTYFLQPVSCGNKKQIQTVRQWLDGFSMLEEESFTVMWHQKVGELSEILRLQGWKWCRKAMPLLRQEIQATGYSDNPVSADKLFLPVQ